MYKHVVFLVHKHIMFLEVSPFQGVLIRLHNLHNVSPIQ